VGQKRWDVARDEVLALAPAQDNRSRVFGDEDPVWVVRIDCEERVASANLCAHEAHRFERLESLIEETIQEMRRNLGVCFRLEDASLFFEQRAQLKVVLDDSVVN